MKTVKQKISIKFRGSVRSCDAQLVEFDTVNEALSYLQAAYGEHSKKALRFLNYGIRNLQRARLKAALRRSEYSAKKLQRRIEQDPVFRKIFENARSSTPSSN